MKISAIILTLFFNCCTLTAQRNNAFGTVDNIMLQIPTASTQTTRGLANYINKHFATQPEKSRAIFIWLAKNIQYDIQGINNSRIYHNTNELIVSALKTHKGVCSHYAELFNEIANMVGIKTFAISGYTKQYGKIDNLPHAWCASLIDSRWYLFDPTWGAGFIQKGRFVRQLNNSYFKVKPEQFISSHIPFDPLWQFLNYPISNQEFYEGKTYVNSKKPVFNFLDSLRKFNNQSKIERLEASKSRIEKNGIKNQMIADRLQQISSEIKNINKNKAVDLYNLAVKEFNNGVDSLNTFIHYRNKQFKPQKADPEIRYMLITVDIAFDEAKKHLHAIQFTDSELLASANHLLKSIGKATVLLNEQKAFVDKYIKTAKPNRKAFFMKT